MATAEVELDRPQEQSSETVKPGPPSDTPLKTWARPHEEAPCGCSSREPTEVPADGHTSPRQVREGRVGRS